MPVIDGSDNPDMPLGYMDDIEQPMGEPKEDFMDTNDDSGYPTNWHPYDVNSNVEIRQISEESYQLRSKTHVLTLNVEGFTLYRDDSPQGQVIFTDWCSRNGVLAVGRHDES